MPTNLNLLAMPARVGQVGNLRPIVNRPDLSGAIANRPQVNNLPHTAMPNGLSHKEQYAH